MSWAWEMREVNCAPGGRAATSEMASVGRGLFPIGWTFRRMTLDDVRAASAARELLRVVYWYGDLRELPFFAPRRSADLADLDHLLEIGTGCGYQTAVIAQLADEVYSVERIKPLLEKETA